ncbi:hypothetical protein ACFVW1_26505 [Streptomyces olivochromogenes]|uniref:hypothetical protein n=1 Tax=Streptomyces olivochromogenes TaxID=1963 RepID=UPI0036DF7672
MSVYSPFQSASTGGQGTYGQAQSYEPFTTGQQARPQDIWDDLGLGSPQQAAQTVQQVGQVIKTISEIAGMFNASPAGQHGQQPGMGGQHGQQPGMGGQQQARPQDIWGDIGSAFGAAGQAVSSAAPDVLRVAKQVAPYLPIVLALASASPAGQQPGMANQYGQQQARPQNFWDDLGLGSPEQAAHTVPEVIKTISAIASLFNASPAGQQPGMGGQHGQQPGMGSQHGQQPGMGGQFGQQPGMGGQFGQQPGMGGQHGQQPGMGGQQQARPQDIWGDIGSAFGAAGQAVSSAAPDVLRVAKQVAPYLPIVLALASASPAGQQPGMANQYGQQQARPQNFWDDLGLGSPQQAAHTVPEVIKTISAIASLFNASPAGQQPGMANQHGRQ